MDRDRPGVGRGLHARDRRPRRLAPGPRSGPGAGSPPPDAAYSRRPRSSWTVRVLLAGVALLADSVQRDLRRRGRAVPGIDRVRVGEVHGRPRGTASRARSAAAGGPHAGEGVGDTQARDAEARPRCVRAGTGCSCAPTRSRKPRPQVKGPGPGIGLAFGAPGTLPRRATALIQSPGFRQAAAEPDSRAREGEAGQSRRRPPRRQQATRVGADGRGCGLAPGQLEPERLPADLGAADPLHDALRLALGHLDEREPLEHANVAHRLAIEAGGGGDRVDDVRGLEPGGPAAGDDQLAQPAPSPLARRAAWSGGAAWA